MGTKNLLMLKKEIFSKVNELDLGQVTINPYILAKRYIASGKALDLATLNSVLAFHGFNLTNQVFDYLKSIE